MKSICLCKSFFWEQSWFHGHFWLTRKKNQTHLKKKKKKIKQPPKAFLLKKRNSPPSSPSAQDTSTALFPAWLIFPACSKLFCWMGPEGKGCFPLSALTRALGHDGFGGGCLHGGQNFLSWCALGVWGIPGVLLGRGLGRWMQVGEGEASCLHHLGEPTGH